MIEIIDKQNCCGCSACAQACPRGCITMREDDEGFVYPIVNKNDCINCNICEKVCPILSRKDKNNTEEKNPLTFVANNPNEQERIASSSGGLFITFAKQILNEKGVVFGARFDENWEVYHTYAELFDDVLPMMGSKYVQSRIENSYKEAERFLKEGRLVLFSGTPCQIQGLYSYLRKSYENLITVDIICHGVPSIGAWRRYLEELKNKYLKSSGVVKKIASQSQNGLSIKSILFRDKNISGWKKYHFRVTMTDKGGNSTVSASYKHYENPYMRGFLSDIYLRPSCYCCNAKAGASNSDITIADFWGIENVCPNYDDDKGTGLLLINTKKGETFVNKIELNRFEVKLEDAIQYNPSWKRSVQPHKKRSYFFKKLKKKKSIEELVYRCLVPSIYEKIIWKTKKILGI